ncbi:MAG: hypothetical protein HQL14_00540 [Candidatus Omnitrophica bacterium]|nr:hypothetical protein [Candidatus Omnitrophota bacterium]
MRSLRILLTLTVASWMTGIGQFTWAQESTAPFSITLSPVVQYAYVKGNVGKFQALNWMKEGGNAGIGDITFVKSINKDISLSVEGSAFEKTDDYTAHLTLTKGDLAFLQIDYNAFRKYYDNTGAVYPNYGTTAGQNVVSGAHANSPDLQIDISYFKLEAGLGPMTDPFIDLTYEHDSKDGYKSMEAWGSATSSLGSRNIAPAWMGVNDTIDRITLKEKKDVAGVTLKGDQKIEVDYNHNQTIMPGLNYNPASSITQVTYGQYPDAKLFGSGVRAEKWMLNDKTFVALGYHYNRIHDTDLTQVLSQTINSSGVVTATGTKWNWNFANGVESDHVWVMNLNSSLTPDLTFLADGRYEHMENSVQSQYAIPTTNANTYTQNVKNRNDHVGEHVALRYSGISHTSLYAESAMEQWRDWNIENYNASGHADYQNRLDRTQKASWTVGMDIVPNRFFTIRNQVKHRIENSRYDTDDATVSNPLYLICLDSLKINSTQVDSTLSWKPYRWVQNSLKYQFIDTVYNPQASAVAESVSHYPVSENHMLSSVFTYDITLQPIDPLLLMLTYSHVENYVRTLAASEPGGANTATYPYIPTFNSGDNSWSFSDSYSPINNLTWTNTVTYTISDNYVNFANGVPLGSNFRMLNFTTGLDWTYHKWLKIGPKYEHASYRDVAGVGGAGNYSANIFMLDAKFSW